MTEAIDLLIMVANGMLTKARGDLEIKRQYTVKGFFKGGYAKSVREQAAIEIAIGEDWCNRLATLIEAVGQTTNAADPSGTTASTHRYPGKLSRQAVLDLLEKEVPSWSPDVPPRLLLENLWAKIRDMKAEP